MREERCDVLVVGGGLGGVAAALAAARLGRHVLLTEETDWIGGQLTAQAVPPDENRWIESFGCTASYRSLRQRIREYYRRNYPLLPDARFDPRLNPGQGTVSRLCHEPRVALAVLEEMLAPHCASGRIRILRHYCPTAVTTDGDQVREVIVENAEQEDSVTVRAPYVLDATELGDLLELASVEYVVGAEGQSQTSEEHANPDGPRSLDQQAITWCLTVDYREGEDHTIERPATYDFWRQYRADFWPGPQLGWTTPDPISLEPRERFLFSDNARDLWRYRRILYRDHFADATIPADISVVNWPQSDYWLGPIVGVSQAERDRHLQGSRELSLSLLYWMQTEAPRPDGGQGYPGLCPRGDVVGTSDGLAKSPYIRESRRIVSEFTICEQHVGVDARERNGAEQFKDSVGIGHYRIDLHPSSSGRNYVDIQSWPFQIPLGALIPVRVTNLLAACKNIGTTHVTNGCYRLHPVEWNIGEASGALAAYCLERKLTPTQVRSVESELEQFQHSLANVLGVELAWPWRDLVEWGDR